MTDINKALIELVSVNVVSDDVTVKENLNTSQKFWFCWEISFHSTIMCITKWQYFLRKVFSGKKTFITSASIWHTFIE